jgi:4-amino-4-deoxy-L-arabinose transferase-like glycosyltransferase
MTPASSPRFLNLSAAQAAILLIAVVTLFRLFYCTWLPMLPDETYYFQWSRHLDASYFSKGPAVAYTIALGTALFGDNHLGVRFFAVLLSAGTAWQLFLLARRWYDETAALLAVLLAGAIPLYAVGAVLMTIDPLSAFFWIWAANLFSAALERNRLIYWFATGFAVGSGFLAKYLNALELVAFIAFLLLVPARRRLLAGAGFWLMLVATFVCTTPVLWWNGQHHWASATQLGNRGHLQDRFQFNPSTFLDFLGSQAVVISPLLFASLLVVAIWIGVSLLRKRTAPVSEGDLFLLLLFLSVFLFYAILALHLRCEPNWPAVSYLSLLVIMAGHGREILAVRWKAAFLAVAFCLAWSETVLLHDTRLLPLPARIDPMDRTAGWSEIAVRLHELQGLYNADEFVADGYKEASILSFDLPGKPFVYALHHEPPANQFDFWPGLPADAPHRVLWVTDDLPPSALAEKFTTIVPLERIEVWYRGGFLRAYRVYLCGNGPSGQNPSP